MSTYLFTQQKRNDLRTYLINPYQVAKTSSRTYLLLLSSSTMLYCLGVVGTRQSIPRNYSANHLQHLALQVIQMLLEMSAYIHSRFCQTPMIAMIWLNHSSYYSTGMCQYQSQVWRKADLENNIVTNNVTDWELRVRISTVTVISPRTHVQSLRDVAMIFSLPIF